MFWSCHLRCHCMHTPCHISSPEPMEQSAEVSLPHLPDYAGQTRSRFWGWWKEMKFNLIDKCQPTSHGLGLKKDLGSKWNHGLHSFQGPLILTQQGISGALGIYIYICAIYVYIGLYWVIMGGMWPTWTEMQDLIQCSLWMQTGFGPQTDQSMLQWPAPAPWRCPTLRKRRTELRCFAMQPGELLHHGLKIYISHVILILIFEDPLKSWKMKMDPDIASFPDTIGASKEATKNMVDRTTVCVSLHKPHRSSGNSPCFSRLQLPLALILCNGDLHCNRCSRKRSLYHHLGHQCSSTGMRNKIKHDQSMSSRWGSTSIPNLLNMLFFLFETWAAAPSTPNPTKSVYVRVGKRWETEMNQGFSGFWVSADICSISKKSPIAWPCHAVPRKNDTRNEEMPKRHDDLPGIAERKWEPRYRTGENVLEFSEMMTCHGLSWFIYFLMYLHIFRFFHYTKKNQQSCIMK